jgi:hypothetical protein
MILGSPRTYSLAGDILAVKLEPELDMFPGYGNTCGTSNHEPQVAFRYVKD